VSRGALTFILTHGIGRAFIAKDVPPSEVLSFLKTSHPEGLKMSHPERSKRSRS